MISFRCVHIKKFPCFFLSYYDDSTKHSPPPPPHTHTHTHIHTHTHTHPHIHTHTGLLPPTLQLKSGE